MVGDISGATPPFQKGEKVHFQLKGTAAVWEKKKRKEKKRKNLCLDNYMSGAKGAAPPLITHRILLKKIPHSKRRLQLKELSQRDMHGHTNFKKSEKPLTVNHREYIC